MKNKFIMLVGIPGSGKSTQAKKIAEKENAVILSSDELRKELYNNVNDQDHNKEVFQELYQRAKQHLQNNKSVIIDATNIAAKKRIHVLNQFKEYQKECYYFNVSLDNVYSQNQERYSRIVPEHVIDRMFKSLQVPAYYEGWNKIYLTYKKQSILRNYYQEIINKGGEIDYYSLFTLLRVATSEFNNIIDSPQDNPNHTLSVSRHTYEVYKALYKLGYTNEEEKTVMLLAALFHDIGKPICKTFKPNAKYANFYGHENVSAQIAASTLSIHDYGSDFVLKVAEIIQLHMRLPWDNNEKIKQKIKQQLGEDLFNKLVIFREADEKAK